MYSAIQEINTFSAQRQSLLSIVPKVPHGHLQVLLLGSPTFDIPSQAVPECHLANQEGLC